MPAKVYQGTDQKKAAAAALIFSNYRTWVYGHRKADLRPFFLIPGSEAGDAYYVDQRDCTCKSRKWNLGPCKHMLAVRLWFQAWQAGEVTCLAISRRDRSVIEADHSGLAELDLADVADQLLLAYEIEQSKASEAASRVVNEGPMRNWWETDNGAPVWLQPQDRYEPDTAAAPANLEPEAVAMIERAERAQFGLADAQRLSAQIDQLDREDELAEAEDQDTDWAALEAYEEHEREEAGLLAMAIDRYEELFPDDPD